MARNAYINNTEIIEKFGINYDNIDQAIGESVTLSIEVLEGKNKIIKMEAG